VLFHCFSGCDGVSIMDALGLRWDQVKPDDHRQPARRQYRDPSRDELLIQIAEADMRQGLRLNSRDLGDYRKALLRQHRGAA